MEILIEPKLADYIDDILSKAYNKGGKYLQQAALFRRRLRETLGELSKEDDFTDYQQNNNGTFVYKPSDDYFCTVYFEICDGIRTGSQLILINSLGWDLNEWVYGYFLQVLSESKKSIEQIITEVINRYLKRNIIQ